MEDFDCAYSNNMLGLPPPVVKPPCSPPSCFVGSYVPVTYAGDRGPFLVNTYFLQPNRIMELSGGPIPITERTLMSKCT